nr:homeodomain-like protein [Tanacetum cinerariifolium]
MNNLESDNESIETPLVSPFPHSDNVSDDGEVLNELIEYKNVGMLRHERAAISFDGDDLAFQCMIKFRKFVAYFDPFLPINIISCKAYNTIIVERLESTEKNLVFVVRDVYVFVGSFTYITNFVVLEDIGEFIMSDMAEILMGKPFKKSLSSNMTLLRDWSHSLRSSTRPEYQVDESVKEWLIHGHKQTRLRTYTKSLKDLCTILSGDGVAGIKGRHRNLSGDDVGNLATVSGRSQLKEDLESSMWRRSQDFKATPSQRFSYIY